MANRNTVRVRTPAKANIRIKNSVTASPGHTVNSRIAVKTRKNARIKVV